MRNGCGVRWLCGWGLLLAAGQSPASPPVAAEFDYGDSLRLEFDQPMQVWGNEARRDVVRLQPHLPLRCAWESDVELACHPDDRQAPRPATRYRIALAAGLKTQQGAGLPPQVLHAETERPTLSAWTRRWERGLPLMQLIPLLHATATDLQAVVTLRIDGQPRPYELQPEQDDDGGPDAPGPRRFNLVLPAGIGPDALVELAVSPGLRTREGPLRGDQDTTLLRLRVNEGFRVRSAGCDGVDDQQTALANDGQASLVCLPREVVRLLLSQALDTASRERWVASLPEGVELVGWGSDEDRRFVQHRPGAPQEAPGHSVRLRVTRANAAISLVLPPGLVSEQGAPMEPFTLHLRTGDARPRLMAAGHRVLLEDGRALPVQMQAINADGIDIAITSMGREFRTENIRTPPAPANIPVALASQASATALAEDGWARWEPRVPQDPTQGYSRWPQRVEFAAPAFDLGVWAGRNEVIAWANEWQDGTAVSGADVELLWMESAATTPRVLARGRTDAQGAAMLRLPAGTSLPHADNGVDYPMWWLRASKSGRRHAARAVLPMGRSQRWGLPLGLPAKQRLWGVSDRPLYAAGAKVRYQLWRREEAGGQLRRSDTRAPVRLALMATSERKTLATWQLAPDGHGVIHGELDLPVHITDDTYCIGAADSYDESGSCFFVGTYRAQDLWAKAEADGRLLRDGDTFTVDVAAGYYSGGAAVDVPLHQVRTMLTGLPLEQAYPQYAGFTFIDVMTEHGRNGIPLADEGRVALKTDRQGKARISLPVGFAEAANDALPAFGKLQATVEVKLSDREGTVSNAASARYARYAHYVGLRSEPRWWDARTPVRLEAVVIDAQGERRASVPVDVDAYFLPSDGGRGNEAVGEPIARCTLVPGQLSECDMPRKRTGRYRLVARSGDAAPAELVEYVWVEGDQRSVPRDVTSLEQAGAVPMAGARMQVVLKHSNPRTRALFVFQRGDALLGYQVFDVPATVQPLSPTLPADAHGRIGISAYVRDTALAEERKAGYRAAVPLRHARLEVDVPRASGPAPSVTVSLQADEARPGQTARLTLHNGSPETRQVVVAVMDDALRAMAGEWLAYSDPKGEHWLGRVRDNGTPWSAGFQGWRLDGWNLRLRWPATLLERAQAVRAGLPPPPEAPPIDIAEPRPTDVAIAPPAPPPQASMSEIRADGVGGFAYDGYDGQTSLDSIQVTGSRIALVDVFGGDDRAPLDLRPREGTVEQPALARVRTRFSDTAFWQAGIVLEPGESRQFDVRLPDNLTRWRAVAWSSNDDDGFEQADAGLEVGLPLEVRLQAPVRLYPGDRARLAANLRQTGGEALPVQATLHGEGSGLATAAHAEHAVTLPAGGQASVGIEVQPRHVGRFQVVASAQSALGHDAVAAPVDVASPVIAARKVQAGWLFDAPVSLALPALPAGTDQARLGVDVRRGGAGLVERWTRDLREYPHRCWEQILSRAVGAALAIERGDTAKWPDAAAVVEEALANAVVFQGPAGGMRYFAESAAHGDALVEPTPHIALTAYTVQAFQWLRQRGHAVPEDVEQRARAYLAMQRVPAATATPSKQAHDMLDRDAVNEAAFALAVRSSAQAEQLDLLWRRWEALVLPARVAATRAFAQAGHPAAAPALSSLLTDFPRRGLARTAHRAVGGERWMGSQLREQCALIGVLRDFPALADEATRRSLLAGLTDLYSGGVQAVDTQSGVHCLVALQGDRAADDRIPAAIDVALGPQATRLTLEVDQDRAQWQTPVARHAPPLSLAQPSGQQAWLGYVAELEYQEDAGQAQPSAVGLSIERRYEVLRDGAWTMLPPQGVYEGDWIRVTLDVRNGAARHFVALTDDVPGGLRPTDLALTAVAGLDLDKVSSEGSFLFRTRRLDARKPKFYAEYLPPGRHQVHYFARVANAGDYLAAPATAELMYGNASHARTAADRLRVAVASSAP